MTLRGLSGTFLELLANKHFFPTRLGDSCYYQSLGESSWERAWQPSRAETGRNVPEIYVESLDLYIWWAPRLSSQVSLSCPFALVIVLNIPSQCCTAALIPPILGTFFLSKLFQFLQKNPINFNLSRNYSQTFPKRLPQCLQDHIGRLLCFLGWNMSPKTLLI